MGKRSPIKRAEDRRGKRFGDMSAKQFREIADKLRELALELEAIATSIDELKADSIGVDGISRPDDAIDGIKLFLANATRSLSKQQTAEESDRRAKERLKASR